MFNAIDLASMAQTIQESYASLAPHTTEIIIACLIGLALLGLIVYVLMCKIADSRLVHVGLALCGAIALVLAVIIAMQHGRLETASDVINDPTIAEVASTEWDIKLLGAVGTTDNGSIDAADETVSTIYDLGPAGYEARWFVGNGETPHFGRLTLDENGQLTLTEYDTDTY